MNSIRDELAEVYEELLFANGFDDAIVGVESSNHRVVYNVEKMVEILVNREGMDSCEAREFLEFNTLFAWVGEKTPIYLYTTEEILCQNI
jgi:hypothetical protein|tara:strand:- start:724 stop:993 length:270 start_codon:yes stop_codon:yes gene_type:complete